MPKLATLKIQPGKMSQSEPTLKSCIFHDYIFNKKYSSPWPKSTRVKNCPYFTVKRAKKQEENT